MKLINFKKHLKNLSQSHIYPKRVKHLAIWLLNRRKIWKNNWKHRWANFIIRIMAREQLQCRKNLTYWWSRWWTTDRKRKTPIQMAFTWPWTPTINEDLMTWSTSPPQRDSYLWKIQPLSTKRCLTTAYKSLSTQSPISPLRAKVLL